MAAARRRGFPGAARFGCPVTLPRIYNTRSGRKVSPPLTIVRPRRAHLFALCGGGGGEGHGVFVVIAVELFPTDR